MPIKIFTALLVQDVQNDFMEDGAMPVVGAESILQPISKIAATFSRVIATQEFRPQDHILFASSHKGRKPGDSKWGEIGFNAELLCGRYRGCGLCPWSSFAYVQSHCHFEGNRPEVGYLFGLPGSRPKNADRSTVIL